MKTTLLVDECINDLNNQIDYFEKNKSEFLSLGETWSKRAYKISNQIRNDKSILINFKKSNIFNSDIPAGNMGKFKKFIFDIFSVLPTFIKFHPYINFIEDGFKVIKEENAIETLEKNIMSSIGNPICYKKKGYNLTYRWLRHILLLSYYEKKLSKVEDIDIVADIGTGYGTFPVLLKKNFKSKKFILIDFPEQLCAAKYYIKSEFPDAKITSFEDIKDLEFLNRDFFKKYDFSFVPCFLIDKIQESSADMFCNFASLNEMPRAWFNKYLQSKLFKSSRYLYTMNRFTRMPMDKNEKEPISILDMPLRDYKKIFFDIFKLYKWNYIPVKILNYPIYSKKVWFDPHYVFIGKK